MNRLLHIDFGDKRVYGLDILRALAIIIVVLSHGDIILPNKVARIQDDVLIDGVFIFFVLSGFLIGTILLKILDTKGASVKTLFDFWIRRWFRTLPTYFLILVVLILVGFIFHGSLGGVNPIPYFFFLQNFSYPHPQFFPVAWSLSVEEWFYLTVPVITFILIRVLKVAPRRAILAVAVAIIVGSIGLRLYRYSLDPVSSITQWDMLFRKEVVYRLDSLMFGVIGAFLAYFYKSIWIKYKVSLFWAGLVLLLGTQILLLEVTQSSSPIIGGWFYLSVFSFSMTALSIFMLLPFLSELKMGKGRIFKAVTYISISSYSMYLIHFSLIQPFIITMFGEHLTRFETIIRYILYWTFTIICSILLYKFFEKPTTNLREKIVSRRASVSTLN